MSEMTYFYGVFLSNQLLISHNYEQTSQLFKKWNLVIKVEHALGVMWFVCKLEMKKKVKKNSRTFNIEESKLDLFSSLQK